MSKQEVIIKDTIALKDFLSSVINETLASKKKLIVEQDEEKEALKSGNITSDEVIEKLNTIRAGKSFKDEQIKSAMESYINDLDDAEKTALFAFLKGIAQIVGGEVEGKQATEPSDKPANVKMEKKPSSQKVTIKPNVIKKPSAGGEKPKEKASKSPEDTTPPAPIVAKKK